MARLGPAARAARPDGARLLHQDALEPHVRSHPLTRSFGREACDGLLVALVFATFVRAFLVQAFRIPSESMEPSLVVGDHLLVNKFVYGPAVSSWERLLPRREIRRGDVLVFRPAQEPEHDFIKRCVGLPGDRVEMVDKRLLVNGEAVDDSAYARRADPHVYPASPLLDPSLRGRDNVGPLRVPAGHVYCLGDNRDASQDSRVFGAVPIERVKGRALLIYWSQWRRIGRLVR